MKNIDILKWIAILHIITAIEIFLFWAGFYSGVIFPKELLAGRIINFAGYYAWEISFTVPDCIMAVIMIIGGIRMLINRKDRLSTTLLIASSGGCMFLGVLDLVYDSFNGMYSLGHFFSFILLTIGIYLPLLGLVSIYCLHKSIKELNNNGGHGSSDV